MDNTFNPYKSALDVLLSKLVKSGYDVPSLLLKIESDVMGNAPYVTFGADYKISVLDALKSTYEGLKQGS